jgi:hypothetical protein
MSKLADESAQPTLRSVFQFARFYAFLLAQVAMRGRADRAAAADPSDQLIRSWLLLEPE